MSITVSIHILNQSENGIAPEGVFLEARFDDADVPENLDRLNYDPSFHRTRVRWTFTNTGQAYGAQASDKVRNLPAAFNDTNTAFGKRVGHVFTEPGEWIIDVEVRDMSGSVGRAQITHRVKDPDVEFPGPRTILVGTADQANYPGSQAVASLTDAIEALENLRQTGQILLQRGATYRDARLQVDGTLPNFHLGAYGAGTRPILRRARQGLVGRFPAMLAVAMSGDLSLQGLQFQGDWDSRSETGSLVDGLRWLASDGHERRYGVIHDCIFDGLEIAVELGRQNAGLEARNTHATYLHQNDVRNWRDMGVFQPSAPQSFLSLTGNVIAQDPDAMMGQNGKAYDGAQLYNQHGPHRAAWVGRAYYAGNDFFSRNSWTTNAIPAVQACLRWNTGTKPGASGVIERNAMEGGDQVIKLVNAEGRERPRHPTNLVIEKNLMVATSQSSGCIWIEVNGVTIRNNLMIKVNAPRMRKAWQAAIISQPRGLSRPDIPVEVYSNSFAVLLDDENRTSMSWHGRANAEAMLLGIVGLDEFPIFEDSNNLLYTPNTDPAFARGLRAGFIHRQMATADGVWDSRMLGMKFQPDAPVMERRYGTQSADVIALTPERPGAVMGLVAIDDFWGQLRGAEPSPGAIEPRVS